MPTFDYKCPSCELIKENVLVNNRKQEVICKQCHEIMKRLFTTSNVRVFPRFGLRLHHVCRGGKTFYSERDMKTYAKEHNLELGALL